MQCSGEGCECIRNCARAVANYERISVHISASRRWSKRRSGRPNYLGPRCHFLEWRNLKSHWSPVLLFEIWFFMGSMVWMSKEILSIFWKSIVIENWFQDHWKINFCSIDRFLTNFDRFSNNSNIYLTFSGFNTHFCVSLKDEFLSIFRFFSKAISYGRLYRSWENRLKNRFIRPDLNWKSINQKNLHHYPMGTEVNRMNDLPKKTRTC